jgi:hypothetical protein
LDRLYSLIAAWEKERGKEGQMRALLCHCRTHLEARDDPSLAEEVREHLVREHPALRPTDEQVWEILTTRAYNFEVYDPKYA